MRTTLTIKRIEQFTCPEGKHQAFLWDDKRPHLAVRVTANSKAFIFESKLNRQTIRRTIGDVREWTIEDARIEAGRLQTQIDAGQDPRELDAQKAAERTAAKLARQAAEREAEERQRYTLRALCSAYVDMLNAKGKKRSASDAQSSFKVHIFETHSSIADTPANAITSKQVAAMVRKVMEAGKERSAGILRSYLSAAFNAAKKAPYDASLPAALIPFNVSTNPADATATIPVRRGDRTLSTEELRLYLTALGSELIDNALLLALLAGGQRMAQLLRAKVSDYDEQAKTLRLWDGKGKRKEAREHLLPLAPRAAAIVESLIKRAAKKESQWLFSTHGNVPMALFTPGKRAAEICKGMQVESFDLRDIRRTCETMMAAMGISKETRAQLLSHGLSGVQAAHYDRHDYINEKRTALVAWEARIEQIEKNEKQPTNVVVLRA